MCVKKEVADEIRSIFYASSKKKANQFFRDFEKKRQQDLPSVVKFVSETLWIPA